MATADRQTPVQSGYALVNGLSMYYEIYGEGRPLILLHGAYMTIDTMVDSCRAWRPRGR